MTIGDLGFAHRFEPAAESPLTLLLLHGTGGSETDLLEFGRMVHPAAALLSPRGKVLENGQARFFRRLAEGVYDMQDLQFRANELADFIELAAAAYKLDLLRIVAAGYSNGANIAGAVLALRPETLAGAVLLRPKLPLHLLGPSPDLRGKAVLIEAGRSDPLATVQETAQLTAGLQASKASVSVYWHDAGHELTLRDAPIARDWLATYSSVPAGTANHQESRRRH